MENVEHVGVNGIKDPTCRIKTVNQPQYLENEPQSVTWYNLVYFRNFRFMDKLCNVDRSDILCFSLSF